MLFHCRLFKSSPSTVSGMWVSRSLFSTECERWKCILEIFFYCHFWKWQWPVYVGCISSCCLNSISCYWMSQCHSVLLLSTYSCFGTIFNRKKLFFSLFKEIWVSLLCWETSNAEALLLIMKGIKGRVVQKTRIALSSTWAETGTLHNFKMSTISIISLSFPDMSLQY